jgi:hypothetical protein
MMFGDVATQTAIRYSRYITVLTFMLTLPLSRGHGRPITDGVGIARIGACLSTSIVAFELWPAALVALAGAIVLARDRKDRDRNQHKLLTQRTYLQGIGSLRAPVPLSWHSFLRLCLAVDVCLCRRNAIAVLMGIELMPTPLTSI